jgi:hypothetical protein
MMAQDIVLEDAAPCAGLRHALLAALARAIGGTGGVGMHAILPAPPGSDDVPMASTPWPSSRRLEMRILFSKCASKSTPVQPRILDRHLSAAAHNILSH